ncbi:uncharacterized protein BDR25DRAFT_262297 [Lindgomyces ingoldianus]|uniref:Uncharacterized protein n=1 Tax=Lindgomyces ingoldianus TaxID=673940 RepID=A0ACB6QTV7_9PLEO|nr:uncharacterized protein BDR25DRAFT_262297 [Lindgomyces ingoldianus]KAF2470413.1 hypothetical protein BDR25DRAFT_262297 [Lindgomyces ingoldianus]
MADLTSYSSNSPPQGTAASPSQATAGEKKAHNNQPRIRRRNRLITSCLECRRRKLKCDKLQPCTNCTKFQRDCVFLAPALDPVGQAKLAEVKEKMGMLERRLEEDVARRGTTKSASPSAGRSTPPLPSLADTHSDPEEPEDEKDLEPTDLALEDCAYYENVDDDLVDLGIQMGKLRITERIGGLVRPRFSEELSQALKEVPELKVQTPFQSQTPESYLGPGREYVAPSSSFFFAPGVQRTSLMTYLPSKVLADKLIDHYWRAVHVIARTVHRPSFEKQYEDFWQQISMGIEPRVSFQAVVLAALLSSVISMSEEKVLNDFAVAKDRLVENFKQGTETTLARANFLRTTKLETLQAFVMYLIPLCRAEVSRAHSALTGTLIRLAECMGLHRDPSHYSSSPLEIHLRRLVWYQICFLDIRTCEATGPRPQIRRDDFDTQYPLNIDDVDLENGGCGGYGPDGKGTEDAKHFTDMTITRMRFECYEMHRLMWLERPRLEKKKTTLTSVLKKIQDFQARMEEKYLPMLDKRLPLHLLATQIYGILSCRLHVAALNKYASNQHRLMPERLRQLMMGTALLTLEYSITIETTPALSLWTWYVGALHQYHTALLLLSELYAKPREPALEERVWRCLDFAFDLPAGLCGADKSRMILEELAGRTQMYQSLRGVRAPTKMKHPGPRIYNYEYQQRREEEEAKKREENIRRSVSLPLSESGQPGMGSYAMSTSPVNQAGQQQQQQQQHLGSLGTSANTGGPTLHHLPPLEYGLAELAPGGVSNPDPNAFGVFVPPTSGSLGPGNTILRPSSMGTSPGQGSDSSSSLYLTHSQSHSGMPATSGGSGSVVGSVSASGSSPNALEGLPDIDWNELDLMFPPTDETMAGDIMIPPYTFPQFSPGDLDLQWGVESGQY